MIFYLRRLWSLFIARNKEFYRDRGSMSWNLLFPVLVLAGFSFAYGGKPKPLYTIGVVDRGSKSEVENWQYAKFVTIGAEQDQIEHAARLVGRHQMDLLIDVVAPGEGHFWVNPTSPQGYILEKMLASVPGIQWHRETTVGREVKFVDWLAPGIIALNMMFSALFGVGYVLVRYRKSGVLKRLKATPITSFEFLLSQVLSRFALISITTLFVFVGAYFVLDLPMAGSPIALAALFAAGTLSLIAMGLVIAARVSSEELAGGLLNLMTWPMMFLSGVWFSLEGLNPWLQRISLLFPLTHLVSASRAIMIDGASFFDWRVAGPFIGLLALALVGLTVGASLFKWETGE